MTNGKSPDMNTNVLSGSAPSDGICAETTGLIAALVALLVAAATHLKRKVAGQPELMSRAECCKKCGI
jgi:hypothetical protein